MSTGQTIKLRRLALGLEQEDLAQFVGVTPDTIGRWERGRFIPNLEDSVSLCRALDLSLDELAGTRPIGQDLSGLWFAFWQTTRNGVEVIDRHTIKAKFASRFVFFTALSGDYIWRLDARHDRGRLHGEYHSIDRGRQSSGVMAFRLNPLADTAVGRWDGESMDGILRYGWGALARSEEKAERSIKWLIANDQPLIDFPRELR